MPDAARKWLETVEAWHKEAMTNKDARINSRAVLVDALGHLRRLLGQNEVLRQSKRGVEYLRQKRIIANLRAQLDEHDAYYRKVVNDECAPDEVHCTCVPALRDKIDELRRLIDGQDIGN